MFCRNAPNHLRARLHNKVWEKELLALCRASNNPNMKIPGLVMLNKSCSEEEARKSLNQFCDRSLSDKERELLTNTGIGATVLGGNHTLCCHKILAFEELKPQFEYMECFVIRHLSARQNRVGYGVRKFLFSAYVL